MATWPLRAVKTPSFTLFASGGFYFSVEALLVLGESLPAVNPLHALKAWGWEFIHQPSNFPPMKLIRDRFLVSLKVKVRTRCRCGIC